MKSQFKGTLAATAALLAIAGIAQAAPLELNIYGASAQFDYWNAQAKNYAANSLGCATVTGPNLNGKHGFVSGTGCTSSLIPAANGGAIEIRYSGIASAEGPLAVKRAAPLDATLNNGCSVTGQRLMYASPTTLACKQVHIGTSDVAGESLTQSSTGLKAGPLGGISFPQALSGVNTAGLDAANTVVVPFGFFVNQAVKAQTCTQGLTGNYCTANSQCDTAPGMTTPDGTCGAAATITNISREEAALIFSGYVANWKDLGDYFVDLPTVVCLRHAGSGTHAALDHTIMNSAWGANMVTAEIPGSIFFNQSSGDMMKCVNGANTRSDDSIPNNANGQLLGAIGYADADQAINVANTSQNVKQLKYNGFYPTRTAIRNGLYDFYTDAWLYTNPINGSQAAIAADMIAFAQLAANVPSSKANYWAAVGEMKFNRIEDKGYPVQSFPSDPQLP